tara:strand:- start:14115 stop:28475 length:14361 start_codon:yes stop_codon:yes gene_type:complete
MLEDLKNLEKEKIDNLPIIEEDQNIENQTENQTKDQTEKPEQTSIEEIPELENQEKYTPTNQGILLAPFQKTPNVQFIGNTGVFEKKEDSYAPLRLEDTYDMNEVRGQRQRTIDKWANGLTKAVGKVGTNVLGGAIGTVYGAGSAILNGSVSKIWDNSIMHALDDANEYMDGKLPNYYTNYEREMSVWQRLGTANFWSDQFTNGLSFVAGAALTEMALSAATAYTFGATGPVQAAYTAALASRAARLLKTAGRGARYLDRAADATKITKAIKNGIKSDKFWEATTMGRQLITGAGFEAGVESRQAYEHMKETLTTNYLRQIEKKEGKARELTLEEKLDIENKARAQANVVFAGNVALVGVSNMIMLGSLYGPGAALKQGYQNAMGKLGLASRPTVMAADGTAKAAYTANRASKLLGISEKNAIRINKAASRIKAVGAPALYEGYIEEGGQSVLSEAAYEYTLAKHGIMGKEGTASLIDSFNRGYIKTFKDPNGQTEVMLGFMLGMLGLPGGTFNNGSWTAAGARLNEVRMNEAFQDVAADYYNKHGRDILTSIKSYADFYTEQQELQALMDKHLADGNIAEYKNLQNDKFFAYVKAKVMTGQFADIKSEADAIREMSDAEFIEYFGYQESDFNSPEEIQARKNKMADSAIRRANKIQQAFKDVDAVLKLTDNQKWTNDKIMGLRERMAHRLASIDLLSEREKSMTELLAKLTGGKVTEGDSKNRGAARTITYVDSEGNEQSFTVGAFSKERAKKYLEEVQKLLDKKDSELVVPEQLKNVVKDVQEYRSFLENQLESTKQFLGLSAGTNRDATLFLDMKEDQALRAFLEAQLKDLINTDPKAADKIEQIVQLFKDLKHVRARRQQFIADYNMARSNPDKTSLRIVQEIEKYVDDVESETAKNNIDDPEAQKLFEEFGTKAKFRVGDKWYRFDSSGNLLEEGTTNVVDSSILKNLGGRDENIVTDKQARAKKLLDAIDELKREKGTRVEKLAKDIGELEKEILDLMIEIEESGLENQVKTGRNKGKFINVKKVTEALAKLEDQINTGEALIEELRKEQKMILDQIDYLEELVSLHYNPKTREFSVDLNKSFNVNKQGQFTERYAAENEALILGAIEQGIPIDQIDRFERLGEIDNELFRLQEQIDVLNREEDSDIRNSNLEALQLEQELLREEAQKIRNAPIITTREDRDAVAEIANDLKTSINEWAGTTNKNIELINLKLDELKGHKDVLEKMIFDRIRELKNSGLDQSNAQNFDDLYQEVIREIEAYVQQVEQREALMKETGQIPDNYEFKGDKLRQQLTYITGTAAKNYNLQGTRLRGMDQDMLDMEMEGVEGLPTYRQFKQFRKNNPDIFQDIEQFFEKLDKVEKTFTESRLLEKHLKATNEEIDELNGIISEYKIQREDGDIDQQFINLDMMLNAIEYMNAVDEILAKLAQIEARVIAPTSTSSTSPNKPNNPPPSGRNYDMQADDMAKNNPFLFKPDIAGPGFYKTAGDQKTAMDTLKKLSIVDGKGNIILDENQEPTMREDLTLGEQNQFRAYRDQLIWFQATSKFVNMKKNKLMAVHSNNIPQDLEKDLKGVFFNNDQGKFMDYSHVDPNTTDIKLVLVDNTGKPVRVNAKGNTPKQGEKSYIVYTSMMGATLKDKNNVNRFTNSAGINVENALNEYKSDRDVILKSKTPILLDIKGMSAGLPNVINTVNGQKVLSPIKGRVIGSRGKKGTKDVVIQLTTKNLEDRGKVYSEITTPSGITYRVPFAGMAFTVTSAGNLAPLHLRTLNPKEAQNVINLLRIVQTRYEALKEDPANAKKDDKKLRQEAALLDVDGKKVFVFQKLKDMLYYGSGTEGQLAEDGVTRVDFFDTGKGYQMGDQFISYQDILDNNTSKLNDFLLNKLVNVNIKSLRNKNGKPSSTTPFYMPFYKETGVNTFELDDSVRFKWDNYEQYLLEAREDAAFAPPLQTNLPLMNNLSYITPQYKFRYLKFDIPGRDSRSGRVYQGEADPQAPENVVYTDIQKQEIKRYEKMLNDAKAGRPIEVEIMEGFKQAVDSKYAANLDNAEGFMLYNGDPKNISDQEYIDQLLEYLEEYKNTSRANSFRDFAFNKFKGRTEENNAAIVQGTTEQEVKENQTEVENEVEKRIEQNEKNIKKAEEAITGPPVQDFSDIPVQEDKEVSDVLGSPAEDNSIQDEIDKANEEKKDELFDDEEINLVVEQVYSGEQILDLAVEESKGVTQEEIDTINKMLPWNKVEFVAGFIKSKTPNVIGQVKGFGRTVVSELAVGGTTYHEGFHQVSYFLLNDKTRKQMYDEVRNNKGSFKDYKGKMVKFSNATDKQAEEYLAEEFRKWILSNETYKKDVYSKPKGFFARLFDRLRNFFRAMFGLDAQLQVDPNMQTVATIFNKIKAGEFADIKAPTETRNVEEVNMALLENDGNVTSARFSMDMMSTFTKHFGKTMFDDPNLKLTLSELEMLSNPNRYDEYNNKLVKIYKTAFSRMYDELGSKIKIYTDLASNTNDTALKDKYNLLAQRAAKARLFLNGGRVKTTRDGNIKSFQEVHRQFLLSIGIDTSLKVEKEENLKNGQSDPFNILESMQFSATGNSHPYIKLLLGTLANETTINITGTTGIVDSNYAMNFIQDRLSGITDPNKQIEKLKQLSDKHVWIKPLVKRLGELDDNSSFDQMKLSNMFAQQMNKTKNTFDSFVLDTEGNFYSVDPNANQLKNIIITPWRNNLKNSNVKDVDGRLLVSVQDGELKINLDYKPKIGKIRNKSLKQINQTGVLRSLVLDDPNTVLELFENFGFEFADRAAILNNLDKTIDGKTIKQILRDSASWVLSELNKPDNTLGADLFSRETIDAQTRLGNLLKVEMLFNDKAVELKHFNAEGKPVYGITLNTYMSLISNKLNSGILPEHFKNNPYVANSLVLKAISADPNAKIEMHVIEGLRIDRAGDQGLHTSHLTYEDRAAMYINSVLNGVIPILRTADAKTEYGVRFPIEQFTDPVDVREQLLGYFVDELTTAVNFNTKGLGKDIKDYNRKGGGLRVFKQIVESRLQPSEMIDLTNVLQGHMPINEFMGKNKSVIQSAIINYLNEEASKNKKLMLQTRILTKGKGNTFLNNGLDTQTVSNITGDKVGKQLTANQVDAIASAFALQNFIGNVEQLKLFFGDVAQYKDLYKRTKLASGTKKFPRVDDRMNSWLNNNEPEVSEEVKENYGEHNKSYNGQANIMIYADPVSESVYWREYAEYLGEDISNLYRNIEEADANAFANIHFYRELMMRIGDWTEQQENLFRKSMLGKELTKEELTAFPTLKPQGFGPAISELKQMVGLKLSLTPIFPQMTRINGQDTALKGLLKDMYESGTDMVMHPTAAKIGSRVDLVTGNAPQFYNEDGTINPIDSDLHTVIDLSYFGIQVDINKEFKGKVTLGTQSRTHILANLYEGGMPADYTGDIASWEKMTPEQKKKASSVHKDASDYLDAVNEITRRSRENLLKRFNLEKVVDSKGEVSYKLTGGNIQKFADMIRDEIAKRNYPENVAAGIESLLNQPDGDKKVFDIIVNKGRLENLLFSLVGNNSITQKVKGENAVQVSSLGSENTVRIVRQGKVESSGRNGLKFYRKKDPNNPNSETLGMEVYLPHYFKEFLGEGLQVRPDGVYNQRGQKVGDSNLLQLIGFRIPTDGLHSIDFMTIKGFLPPQSGAQVMVPSELVVKAGSDFDIDKLTLYMPSYTVKDGKITKREFINADTNTKEGIKQYYDALYGPFNRFWDKFSKDLVNARAQEMGSTEAAVENLLLAIFRDNPNVAGDQLYDYSDAEIEVLFSRFKKLANNPDKDRADRVEDVVAEFKKLEKKANKIPSLDEFFIENKGKNPVELNHMGAVQNRMIDLKTKILSTPRSYTQLLNPIGTRVILDIRSELGIAERQVSDAELISYPHIFNITKDFQSGKNGLGIAATNATHIVKSQQAGLYLRPNVTIEGVKEFSNIGINIEGFSGLTGSAIRLDRIYDIKGEHRITEIASELLNVFADASEDPIVADLNLVPEVGNALMFLLRSGVPVREAVFFINQPIIKEYISRLNANSSKINMVKNNPQSKATIFNAVLGYYAPTKKGSRRTPKLFSAENLKEMSTKTRTEIIEQGLGEDQLQVLEDFVLYDAVGGELTGLTLATSFDTAIPKSRNHAKLLLNKFDDIKHRNVFGNIDNLIQRTHLNEFYLTHEAASKQFNSMFLTERAGPRAVGQLDAIFDIFSDPRLPLSEAARLTVLNEAENELIVAALLAENFDGVKLGNKAEQLFLGERSAAKRVTELQKLYPNNPFLQSLLPSVEKVRTGPLRGTDNIKLYSRILNNYEANSLRDAFLELPETDQNMLIDHAILQSGMSLNNMSYLHILPTEKFTERAVRIVSKLDPSNTDVVNFFDNFFRNNWHNSKIVPRLPRSKYKIKDNAVYPSIKNSDPTSKFPYVGISMDAVESKEADELKKKGLPVPKTLLLFKKSLSQSVESAYTQYEPVDRLGNGLNLKEYPTDPNQKSILDKNNLKYDQAKDVFSKQIITPLDITLNKFEEMQIKKGNAKTLTVPTGKLKSGKIYTLPGNIKVYVKLVDEIMYKGLDTAEELDNFARNEGYTSWDKMLPKIKSGKNKIPSSWLDTSKNQKMSVYEIVGVDKSNDSTLENDYNKAVTIEAQNPEYYMDKEGELIVEEQLRRDIKNQIENGVRKFKTKLLPGSGRIATEILMQEQVRLDKINQDLSLEIGVPGKNFVNDMNPEDRMRHGIILRQLRKRRNVTIKGTKAIADTKTNIRLNAKEISEQIEIDKKTTCK